MKQLFLLFCLILYSCVEELDGDCYPILPDGLSFNSHEGIDSTIVYGYQWWFTGIRKEEKCEFIKPEKIECHWFSAEKAHDNIIIVSVKQNNTNQEREIYVNIEGNDGGGGECSKNKGGFTITQCPELIDMELSKDELLFASEGGIDSVIVTTNRNSWLDSLFMKVNYENISYAFEPYRVGFDFSNYVSKYSYIKDLWFNINIIDERKIIFSINKNESGKDRNFSVKLDIGDCGPSIKVIQSAGTRQTHSTCLYGSR